VRRWRGGETSNMVYGTSLPAPEQEAHSALSEATREAILALRGKYPEVQSAILDALRLAQDEAGYLPVEATNEVAALLGLSPHHVRSLATFYTMFFTEPVGTHIVEVCDNLSCALWGSQRILAKLEEELGIAVGDTTPDGSVTLLRTIECLAACGGAPAIRVNTTYYEKMTDEKVVALVKELIGGSGSEVQDDKTPNPEPRTPNRGAK
jgi:NADH-quinone oxidoreductase subunit E